MTSAPTISLEIDGHQVEVASGQSVLDAARKLRIDIPTLCYLEKCGPLTSCLVCLVKINGKLVPSCGTRAEPGMVVESETTEIHEARRTALELLFSDHVGDCLSPCNRLCPLRMNIPVMIRQIQSGKLADAIVTIRDALPLPSILGRLCHHPCEQGCRRASWDNTAGIRGMERFVADWNLGLSSKPRRVDYPAAGSGTVSSDNEPFLPRKRPSTGKNIVIVGAGPAGLTAAYHLLRQGHSCTVADRNQKAGGSLRAVAAEALPEDVLSAEIQQLEKLGVHFILGACLGKDLSIDGLLRGFDVALLCLGETSKSEGELWGLEMMPGGIRVDSETFQTNLPRVFAAGRSVKPAPQLVRAMSEGLNAAECIHQFLMGKEVKRAAKPFSSVMGRLDQEEIAVFMESASPSGAISACDACAGFNEQEAVTEAARCLHCDCRSAGDCVLQTYGQTYGVDATRFRQQRKHFEQQVQPGGVLYEPGKCILCGICVKLTELAAEPLGLTFIGRGFDVRVAAPLNRTIEEGLQKVAADCVEHCPTGALVFRENRVAEQAHHPGPQRPT